MKGKVVTILERYGKYLVPLMFLLAVVGLITNYMYPNEKLRTLEMNMEEGGEKTIALSTETTVSYTLNTDQPMRGIQIGVDEQGQNFTAGNLVYTVTKTDSGEQVASGNVALQTLFDIQYVYMPFADKEKCQGDLTIIFSYDGADAGIYPYLIANDTEVENTQTFVDDSLYEGSLKANYIYSYYSYPFKLDLQYMLLLFAAALILIIPGKREKNYA